MEIIELDNKNNDEPMKEEDRELLREAEKAYEELLNTKPEFFSGRVLKMQGKTESEIIFWLINRTQEIMDEKGEEINIADIVDSKCNNSPFNIGYRGVVEILQDYVNWIEIEDIEL